MKYWYLIQAKPRQENRAKENLERQGYTVYLPIARIRRQRRGKVHSAFGPMFPMYLFIFLGDGIDDWGPIRSTAGVSKLVKFGQIPARVPGTLIDALKAREDASGIQVLPEKMYQVGDRVRISEGPFEGYEAVIFAKSARERTILLLKVIENYIKLELDSHHLESL